MSPALAGISLRESLFFIFNNPRSRDSIQDAEILMREETGVSGEKLEVRDQMKTVVSLSLHYNRRKKEILRL